MWQDTALRSLESGLGCGSRNSQVTLARKINANVTFAIKCCQSTAKLYSHPLPLPLPLPFHCKLVVYLPSIRHSSGQRRTKDMSPFPCSTTPPLPHHWQRVLGYGSPAHRPRKSHLLTDLWLLPCSGFYLLSFWRNHFKSKCFQKATAPGPVSSLSQSTDTRTRTRTRTLPRTLTPSRSLANNPVVAR